MSGPDYNRRPDSPGKLLLKAREVFETTLKDNGWEFRRTGEIRNYGLQGWRYEVAAPGAVYIMTCNAKLYMRWGNWWSVSESVLRAASSGFVATYFEDRHEIRVGDPRGANEDKDVVRFGEKYYGWTLKKSMELKEWLSGLRIPVQTSLMGGE